ncbi:Imm49 family immunity protein [Archangium sp.]|uniref:Imm49 family immunity protein n=1 Tax=Archangium sp. TaxID=1872627 RepID=UPI002D4FD01F|nr:Imm49 family immunity protein [Archangium sp.]HYO56132.1 Imm49 family immunity protein [Archangium sp.]
MQDHELNAHASVDILEMDLASGRRSPADRERILFYLSRYGRIAALSGLLGRADIDGFHARLRHSGAHRRQLLSERKEQGRPFTHFSCTSHIAPLCDAIASGAEALARDIAALSATTWLWRDEFEDDFHYGCLLGWLVSSDGASAPEAESLLDSLIRSSGDDAAPRVRLCRALLKREPRVFDEALRELLEARASSFRNKVGSLGARDAHFETERHVFVEGLALLRLAELRGISVEEEYPLLPGLVRLRPVVAATP